MQIVQGKSSLKNLWHDVAEYVDAIKVDALKLNVLPSYWRIRFNAYRSWDMLGENPNHHYWHPYLTCRRASMGTSVELVSHLHRYVPVPYPAKGLAITKNTALFKGEVKWDGPAYPKFAIVCLYGGVLKWWRGRFAKPLDRLRGARVRTPPPPPIFYIWRGTQVWLKGLAWKAGRPWEWCEGSNPSLSARRLVVKTTGL